MSYVDPHVVSCPAGDSAFVVNNPVNWWDVTLQICTCPGYRLSTSGIHPYQVDTTGCLVSLIPDLDGYARFPLAGGGLCAGNMVKAYGGGVLLGQVTRVASFDQNGDLRVDATDLALIRGKVGTSDPTADFDGDGAVTNADVAIAQQHLGHAAPDALLPTVRSTWGSLKLLYH
jgi:hypothetical protein